MSTNRSAADAVEHGGRRFVRVDCADFSAAFTGWVVWVLANPSTEMLAQGRSLIEGLASDRAHLLQLMGNADWATLAPLVAKMEADLRSVLAFLASLWFTGSDEKAEAWGAEAVHLLSRDYRPIFEWLLQQTRDLVTGLAPGSELGLLRLLQQIPAAPTRASRLN